MNRNHQQEWLTLTCWLSTNINQGSDCGVLSVCVCVCVCALVCAPVCVCLFVAVELFTLLFLIRSAEMITAANVPINSRACPPVLVVLLPFLLCCAEEMFAHTTCLRSYSCSRLRSHIELNPAVMAFSASQTGAAYCPQLPFWCHWVFLTLQSIIHHDN